MSRGSEIVLAPGDVVFVEGAMRLRTLLGSCVAITLWHPTRQLGGMCHYLLPTRGPARAGEVLDGRYGDEAVDLLLEQVERYGSRPGDYEVKMFGGGDQFGRSVRRGGFGVPARNVDAGLRLLRGHGLTLSARHVGGTGPREIVLDVATGVVWHRLVKDAGDTRGVEVLA